MKIGVHIPQWGDGATRSGVLDVARSADAAGLNSVWVSDHVVFPMDGGGDYPYQKDGRTPFAAEDGFLEGFTMLAAIAGATEHVELGTSVMVLPMRHPLLTAKVVGSLDVLSGGRAILGVGAGWWEAEFTAMDQRFSGRGRAMDECLEILRMLWTEGEGAYHGEYYDFERVACLPKPVQSGGPPVLIGGTSERARQRAGRLGSGWHAIGGRPDRLAEGIADVRSIAAAAGRDPDGLLFSTVTQMPTDPEKARRFAELAEVGIGHVVLGVPSNDPVECCRAIETFATTILPEVREMVDQATSAS